MTDDYDVASIMSAMMSFIYFVIIKKYVFRFSGTWYQVPVLYVQYVQYIQYSTVKAVKEKEREEKEGFSAKLD